MEIVTTENEIREIVSHNIKVLMQKHGMTQSDLARAMFPEDMKDATSSIAASKRNFISRWVRAARTPNASDCVNLSEVFGITVEKLVGKKMKIPKKKELQKN